VKSELGTGYWMLSEAISRFIGAGLLVDWSLAYGKWFMVNGLW